MHTETPIETPEERAIRVLKQSASGLDCAGSSEASFFDGWAQDIERGYSVASVWTLILKRYVRTGNDDMIASLERELFKPWLDAQPRRVPGPDTSAQDAEDYRKEQEDLEAARSFLLRLKTERGSIVSSGDCSALEIADAQACRRFHIDQHGYGYVLRRAQS